MKNPRISVVMPAFNAERFIGQAMDSILNQTLQDSELIVVDDGSMDATLEIVNRRANEDSRIRLVRFPLVI